MTPVVIAYIIGLIEDLGPDKQGNAESEKTTEQQTEYKVAPNALVILKLYNLISMEQQKERIFSQINTNGVHVKRLVSSNRKLIFRYTYRQTGKTVEIVFTPDELRENKMK